MELCKGQNEELQTLKNELDLKIENLKREVASRQSEIQLIGQVKEGELKALRTAHMKQIAEQDEELEGLEAQRASL